MNSTEIRQPPEVLQCLEEMREKQDALNTKRLDLLNSLRYEKRFFKPSKLDNLLTKTKGALRNFVPIFVKGIFS